LFSELGMEIHSGGALICATGGGAYGLGPTSRGAPGPRGSQQVPTSPKALGLEKGNAL
jgi:hypothetical protein